MIAISSISSLSSPMLDFDASGGATKARRDADRPRRSARLDDEAEAEAAVGISGRPLGTGASPSRWLGGVWSENEEEDVEGEGPGEASMTAIRRLLLPLPGEKGAPGGWRRWASFAVVVWVDDRLGEDGFESGDENWATRGVTSESWDGDSGSCGTV